MTATPVTVSAELTAHLPSGIELCYQTFGDPADEPILLVMGLGGPMIWWDPGFCTMLAEAGFFVIRYDNRDTGHSTRLPDLRVSRSLLVRAFLGQRVRPPYTLSDLADDGFGLLDHLGIGSAHVVGISMGGMIAQTMALAAPQRVRSLTSIMSTTGRRTVGWQDPKLLPRLLQSRPRSKEEYVAASAAFWAMIGSPDYPVESEEVNARASDTWDRGINPAGVLRQMVAILTQPDRTRMLHGLHVPTLVVHGLSDRMVHASGGRATASAVPGAELLLISGMGHDLPVELYPQLVQAIRRVADRAARSAADRG